MPQKPVSRSNLLTYRPFVLGTNPRRKVYQRFYDANLPVFEKISRAQLESTHSMTTMAANKPRRGRPPVCDPADRRDQILDAMQAVYNQDGMAGLTMSAIAKAAGMSKRTLYTVFEDRADMLEAYTERRVNRIVSNLTPAETELPLAERLRLLLTPDESSLSLPIAILRTIIIDAVDQPEMAERIYSRSLPVIRTRIKAELDRANERSEAQIDDTQQMAELLADMVRPSPMDALILQKNRDPSEIMARFELGLDIFLKGLNLK